jgi:UrcA family protein
MTQFISIYRCPIPASRARYEYRNDESTRIHEEIDMYTKTIAMSAWPVLGAALVACTLFAGSATANDQEFTVAYRVNTRGLDLSTPAGAHTLYSRIKHAAEVVCTHGNRVDLKPLADPIGCYEKALGNAVRFLNSSLLTQVYLETHTLRQAAAHNIDIPALVAAK